MLNRIVSQARCFRTATVLAIASLFSAAVQAREYTIEYGDQYDLCHEAKEVLKKVPEGVDPMCGLPEPDEGSLLANLDWKPYDYGGDKDFLAKALHQGSPIPDDERYQSRVFKEFERNHPDTSSVERSEFRFSPDRSTVPIYKISLNRCEEGDFMEFVREKEYAYPRFYTPDTHGLDLSGDPFSRTSDIFRYDARYYGYNFSSAPRVDGMFLEVYEFRANSLEHALKTRVCRFVPED